MADENMSPPEDQPVKQEPLGAEPMSEPPSMPEPPPSQQYAPPPPAPPTAPRVVPPPGEKSKVVSGVLGILLGGFGLHKFYLGYTNEGIIMLAGNLLWIVGLGWVPNLIGIVEGVIYIFKTDEDFYNAYVVGRRPWL